MNVNTQNERNSPMLTRTFVLTVIFAMLLAACGSGDEPTPTVVPVPTFTPTSVPAAAAAPTPEPSPTTDAPSQNETNTTSAITLSDDTDQAMDLGGVEIVVKGMGLMEWPAVVDEIPEMAMFVDMDMFADATAMGLIAVEVTNNTQGNASVHPAQGTVVVGSEQVDLGRYMFFSEDVGGEIFPGVTKAGNVVFALEQTAMADLAGGTEVLYVVGGPFDGEFNRLAEGDYEFRAQVLPGKQ